MKLDYIKITDKCGEMHGGNQSDFGRKIKRSGCGMIAACDLLLYLQNKKNISDSEYKLFVENEAKNFFYRFHLNIIGITATRIIRYLGRKGYSFRFVSRRKLKGECFEQLITESLKKGIPVIVRVGLNGNRLAYKVVNPKNGRVFQDTMSWHYITVTGLKNGVLTYSSWGSAGEMQIDNLQKNLGFTGGIICLE